MKENFLIRYSVPIIAINAIGIIICTLIIIITCIIHEFSKPTFLTIQLAPGSAILTLENTNAKFRTGTYEFQPGTYTGTITAKGFNPKTVNFEVKPRTTNSLVAYLVNSTEGLGYYEKSAANISTLRLIKDDQEVTSFLDSYDKKLAIFNELPISATWLKKQDDYPTYTMTISNGNDSPKCLGTLCLIAKAPIENYTEIKKELAKRGYNLDNYEVIYEKSF